MATCIGVLTGVLVFYLALCLGMAWLVQAYPRQPVSNPPDWGEVTDIAVPAADGGFLETWSVSAMGTCRGTVLFVHGWGRNRDRMVERARLFAGWGYRAILFSARDHGGSSRCRSMNALKFAEDIESVLNWLDEPVILYGHSAGSGGAAIAASRNDHRIRVLMLEASYADTRTALSSLYRWANPAFGRIFGPGIFFWFERFYPNAMDRYSPARLARSITMPVMLIHGEADRRFPVAFARELYDCFQKDRCELYIAPGARHSESSQTPGYGPAVKAFLERHDPSWG